MTPPEVPETGIASVGAEPRAVSESAGPEPVICEPAHFGPAPVETLTQRADFLRAARARAVRMPGMVVQARLRRDGESSGIRVGYTCSKKVGNAVARNRAKRRLRAVARSVLPQHGLDGWDYVLIGRAGVTAQRSFDAMLTDFAAALARLHKPPEERNTR